MAVAMQARHTLVCQAEHAAVLRLRGDGQYEFAPVQDGHRNFAPQHCRNQVHVYIEIQIIALTLVNCVGFDTDDQEEVAARSTTDTRLSLTRYADPGTILNPRRNLHLDALITRTHTLSATIRASFATDFACATPATTYFRRLNIEGARPSHVCFLQCHLNRLFDIVTCAPAEIITACAVSRPPPLRRRPAEKGWQGISETPG